MPIVKRKKGYGWNAENEQQCVDCTKKRYCKSVGKILPCVARTTLLEIMNKQAKKAQANLEKMHKSIIPRKIITPEVKKQIISLLTKVKSCKAQVEQQFYSGGPDKRIVCFTMKEDYAWFQKQLEELI